MYEVALASAIAGGAALWLGPSLVSVFKGRRAQGLIGLAFPVVLFFTLLPGLFLESWWAFLALMAIPASAYLISVVGAIRPAGEGSVWAQAPDLWRKRVGRGVLGLLGAAGVAFGIAAGVSMIDRLVSERPPLLPATAETVTVCVAEQALVGERLRVDGIWGGFPHERGSVMNDGNRFGLSDESDECFIEVYLWSSTENQGLSEDTRGRWLKVEGTLRQGEYGMELIEALLPNPPNWVDGQAG